MHRCPNCQSLDGQSADVDPHIDMSGRWHQLVDHGVKEVYQCRPCGTYWERFVARKVLGATSGSWRTIKSRG